MNEQQQNFTVVFHDEGKCIYVNCRCGNNLLRLQANNHAVKLIQWSMAPQSHQLHGRCSRCNIRHDSFELDLSGSVRAFETWLDYQGWVFREYNGAPGTVSTKNLGELEGFTEELASDEKRGIRPATPREKRRRAAQEF